LKHRIICASALVILFIIIFSFFVPPVTAQLLAQQPTVEIPTVTSTPGGPYVVVRSDQESYINVRSGPGIFYEKIGVLLPGQQISAKGRSVGGDWILVEYPGVTGGVAWVYAPFVDLSPGTLPIIEPPPTPTPLYTSTIDPTLAAQFIVTTAPTRLPTFTEPAPLIISTYTSDVSQGSILGIPVGFVILVLLSGGVFLGLFAFSQSR
jgi:hypothetical protein